MDRIYGIYRGGEIHIGLSWVNMKHRVNLEGLGIDEEDTVAVDLNRIGEHGLNECDA